jgi:hypothetical protein
MDRAGHKQVDFFVGNEVEHTPAFGMKTLFVVGIQDTETILLTAHKNECRHVYFGANQSFPNPDFNDATIWKQWENMILVTLQLGLLCTLDIDVKSVEGLIEGPLCEYNNFIPMISVKLPSLQMLGYNATIKLDDKDFAATNPGVWCHSLHDLKDRSKFTDWSKYTKDEVIK